MAQVPARYIKDKAIDYDGEIFACMSLPVRVAGIQLRPPSIGVFALLETIESPVVANFAKATAFDCYRALYILKHGREAACEVRDWLAAGGRKKVKPEDETTWLPWDKRVASFAEFNPTDLFEFAALHRLLMDNSFGGFEMIPQIDPGCSPYIFGAESIANTCRLAASATNYTYDEILWDLPLCLVGHIAAVAARGAGVKGVGRPKDKADIKKQLKAAAKRERTGKLHPWQKAEPHCYPLSKEQIEANPAIEKEFNAAMKTYLAKLRKKKGRRK
jgi:hypothetical protein